MTIEAQNTIQSYELDRLADRAIIPMIEKIGQMLANFKEDPEKICYQNHKGENGVGIIDDEVRCANYSYVINDPQNSATEKLNNMDFLNALIGQLGPYMAATQQGKLDVKKILDTLAQSYDKINPEGFILQEMPQGMPVMTPGQPLQGAPGQSIQGQLPLPVQSGSVMPSGPQPWNNPGITPQGASPIGEAPALNIVNTETKSNNPSTPNQTYVGNQYTSFYGG